MGQPAPKPKAFYAKQLMVDDDMAPVMPPDLIEKMPFTSVEEARQKHKELQGKHRRRHNQYVPGALYQNLFPDKFTILNHDEVGDFDITVEYTPVASSIRKAYRKRKNMNGEPMVPTATTTVKVRSARDHSHYLGALFVVDAQLMAGKGTVRQGRGDIGKMWQVGVKNRGLMTKKHKHYRATESAFIMIDKKDVAGSPFLCYMNYHMSEFFMSAFPEECQEIQRSNEGMNKDDRVGGDGSFHTFSISRDLGNSAHVDSRDESVSLCTWIEEEPGKAKNWFFILPNTYLIDNPSQAVVIKLSHGLSISWDGRVLHHCTSVTDTGVRNHVYGNFTSASKARSRG